ncbi:endosome-associated-trafficking regulator 1-like [Gigantopelta aegis]|uniref:endosome-associated-trafficking regulator 1-like n=1 Tax=Gigantopelta aegis TaxID=1735272 RepID=UPI001B8878B4|nr:endosome-associated-trafficking regulator 1-like [Gigantopelta aegis]
MAEGGEDDPENPFSFSKFVKKKKKNTQFCEQETENRDIDDIFDLPDVSVCQRREKTLIVADEDESEESGASSQKKKQGAGNPFSFKRFLATPSSSSTRSRNVAPDFASDLPDFVQDHFTGDGRGKTIHITNNDPDLPDVSLSSSPRVNTEGDFPAEAAGLDSANSLDNSFNSDTEPDSVLSRVRLPSRMPDFLPDGVVGGSGLLNDAYDDSASNPLYASRNVSTVEVSGDVELELRRVRKENEDLRLELEQVKHLAQSESNRVTELIKRMERQHQKEVDETNVLERAVMQVEENLVTTTQRAVQAETAVTRLKQEIKTLQHQISSLQAENKLLSSGDRGLAEIRERTKYASEQLASSAKIGEQQIKQLQSGVENLRLLSQVLASVDKIKDYVPPTTEPTGDT